MNDHEILFDMINENISQMDQIIDHIYTAQNSYNRNRLLNQLRKNIFAVTVLIRGLQKSTGADHPQSDGARIFTPAELAACNGKNGNPAYVAVNGIVYDVTNAAAWAGAVHFGLSAGRDVTGEFAVCHAGQQILNGLKAVGKMAG